MSGVARRRPDLDPVRLFGILHHLLLEEMRDYSVVRRIQVRDRIMEEGRVGDGVRQRRRRHHPQLANPFLLLIRREVPVESLHRLCDHTLAALVDRNKVRELAPGPSKRSRDALTTGDNHRAHVEEMNDAALLAGGLAILFAEGRVDGLGDPRRRRRSGR